ncbi:MAG: NADH-quinone oxidoreductase subunit NuoN [Candidatus Aminicenantes bacterium]|nr:NADH-quinone oxidoreductase subunit NuoN [Candidatus Aminicenantes bacterium]
MNNIWTLLPIVFVLTGSLLVLLLEVFIQRETKDYLGFVSLMFLVLSGAACVTFWNKGYSYFNGDLFLDKLALFLSLLFIIGTALIILISMKYLSLQNTNYGEYYSLLLFALIGTLIMVSSTDLIIIFLGLEVLSMSSYALAGLKRNDEKSGEAALKYFLLGSFASAFLIYGIAFLYGTSKSTEIFSIIDHFQAVSSQSILVIAGFGLLIIGFGFKIAVVPFHMWTPDVYQGSPTPITAFFSVLPKAAGFAVLLRLFGPYFGQITQSQNIFMVLWFLSVLTMVAGNLLALRQKNIKRLLAYSSIAHAGYLMIAVLAKSHYSLVFYLTVYLFMNIGAFSAVIALSKKDKEYLQLKDYAGIGFRYPWIGATLSIFLLSLAGFPPTGGFLAKFYVFSEAVSQDLVPLVVIGVLASLISVFYYLRVIVYMYMREPSTPFEIDTNNAPLVLVLFICLYGVIQLGIYPGNVLLFIKQAVASLPF